MHVNIQPVKRKALMMQHFTISTVLHVVYRSAYFNVAYVVSSFAREHRKAVIISKASKGSRQAENNERCQT